MTKLLKIVLVIVMMLSSCANNDRQNNSSLTRDTTALDIKNKNVYTSIIVSYFKMKSDSIIISPFEIEVSLSPKAKEKIIAEKEIIIVDVFLQGYQKTILTQSLKKMAHFMLYPLKKKFFMDKLQVLTV